MPRCKPSASRANRARRKGPLRSPVRARPRAPNRVAAGNPAKSCMRFSRSSTGMSGASPVTTGKWNFPCSGRSRITPCTSTSAMSRAVAQKSDRSPLDNFHLDRVRKRPANRGLLDPGNRFESGAAVRQRNAQDAAAAIGTKNIQHARARNVAIAGKFHLIGMNQRTFPARSAGNARRLIGEPRARDTHRGPSRNAQIRLPGFAAEFAALDLDRLLPPKILRLFVGQDFLGVNFRLDGFQFCQTITSFSSSIP